MALASSGVIIRTSVPILCWSATFFLKRSTSFSLERMKRYPSWRKSHGTPISSSKRLKNAMPRSENSISTRVANCTRMPPAALLVEPEPIVSRKAAGGIRVQFATRVEIEFSLRGIAFFKRFEDEMGVPCDFRQEGYLFILSSEKDVERFKKNVALQQSMGTDVRMITPDDAKAIVPGLRVDDAIAAVWGPTDGYASPNDVVQAYAARARAGGVKFFEDMPVTGIELDGRKVSAVVTPAGRIETRLVINAAGP